jgi:hypothetical protein
MSVALSLFEPAPCSGEVQMLQRLHVVGGRAAALTTTTGATDEGRVGGDGGTHDGYDGSYDQFLASGDETDPGEGACRFTYRMEPTNTGGGTICFVRVSVRTKSLSATASYARVQTCAGDPGDYNADSPAVDLTNGFAEYYYDYELDPHTGQSWTDAVVQDACDNNRFGFVLAAKSADAWSGAAVRNSEFVVELWGSPAAGLESATPQGAGTSNFLRAWRSAAKQPVLLAKIELTQPSTRTLYLASGSVVTPGPQAWEAALAPSGTIRAPGEAYGALMDLCFADITILKKKLGFQDVGKDARHLPLQFQLYGSSCTVTLYLWERSLTSAADMLQVFKGSPNRSRVTPTGLQLFLIQPR